jgi:ATP adenylyltransferase
LVECGGSATVRQIAQAVLSNDESQLHYYEQRIKQMPVEVLKNHGVLERDGELVSLNLKKMSLKEKSELLMLCEQKMREFVQENDDIWDSRFATAPVSTGVRYEVLKRANKRCALCGVQEGDEGYEDRLPLHIDHIEPRSKGGSNEIDNLQVLCRACNLGKSNRDDTDFR